MSQTRITREVKPTLLSQRAEVPQPPTRVSVSGTKVGGAKVSLPESESGAFSHCCESDPFSKKPALTTSRLFIASPAGGPSPRPLPISFLHPSSSTTHSASLCLRFPTQLAALIHSVSLYVASSLPLVWRIHFKTLFNLDTFKMDRLISAWSF